MASENSKLTVNTSFHKRKRKDPKTRIRFRTTFRNVVYDALKSRGWRESIPSSPSDPATPSHLNRHDLDWDIMWADREWMREVFDTIHLEPHQKVNHYRNYYELTRKDMMAKNIKRYRRMLSRRGDKEQAAKFNFIPQTYALPREYSIFVDRFKRTASSTQWIMKPVGRCQGRGIFLFSKLSDIADWKYRPNEPSNSNAASSNDTSVDDEEQKIESYVVQQYIHEPYLIGNKKFDLRIYVLVTSYSPLTVYIYRSGFARFTNSRYSYSAATLDDTHMHLTNAAVQKQNEEYSAENDLKWDIRSLKLYLITQHGETRINALFKEIQNVIIRSLICVQSVMINDKHCFELYGYDVMIDKDLAVWLIESNAAPSFTATSNDDYLIKFSVINDCLDIVMDPKIDANEKQLQFGGFDLVYKGGYVEFHERCLITSYLGCQNPSLQKYKEILEQTKKMRKKQ